MKTFNHVKLDALNFDLESVTLPTGRTYVAPDGTKYPSVTTVLSTYNKKAILEWRKRVGEEEANKISTKASTRGTKLHSVCEKYLLNELTDMKMRSMMPDTKSLFLKMRDRIDDSIDNIYSIEQALYSKKLRVAGRVDCIAEWDGVLSVIDFKTSSKLKKEEYIENYFMQCTTYTVMFEELTGIPIGQIVVAIAVENEDPQFFIKQQEQYLHKTVNFINNYHLTNPSVGV